MRSDFSQQEDMDTWGFQRHLQAPNCPLDLMTASISAGKLQAQLSFFNVLLLNLGRLGTVENQRMLVPPINAGHLKCIDIQAEQLKMDT